MSPIGGDGEPKVDELSGLAGENLLTRGVFHFLLMWALSHSTTAVTCAQPLRVNPANSVRTDCSILATVTAPGPVNRAQSTDELAEEAHYPSTKQAMCLVGAV